MQKLPNKGKAARKAEHENTTGLCGYEETSKTYEDLVSEIAALKKDYSEQSRKLLAAERTVATYKSNAQTQQIVNRIRTAESEKQNRWLSVILDNSPDIIFLTDCDFKYLVGTSNITEIFDVFNSGLLAGGDFRTQAKLYLTPETAELFISYAEKVISSQEKFVIFEFLLESKTKSGFNKYYEVTMTPFRDEDHSVAGVVTLVHDCTVLISAKNEANSASEAKTNFLASMSHEIRTPMNAIIGLIDTIEREPLSEMQKSRLRTMKMSAKSLLSIINDILDLSRINSGHLDLIDESVNLKTLLEEVYSSFIISAESKGLDFQTSFRETLPEFIRSDENKLRQILTNIISNAIKYTPKGYVYFYAETERTFSGTENLIFRVKDSGIGIKEEDIGTLFDLFSRVDKEKNKNNIGTGLGLSITEKIVKAMDGNIFVNSKCDEGSEFIVVLPLVLAEESIKEESILPSFFAPDARVLVVDDVDVNIIVAEAVLFDYEIVPDTALSGEEAIKMCLENEYDIIFMDQMMPDMDGLETTRRLRALNGYTKTVPIIALTANVMPGAEQEFKEAGCDDFMAKPIEISKMISCLINFLPSHLVQYL